MARILVIDDDHAVRLTIQVILERDGHEVICASDGDQGLRAFASALPQLVITDIIMPNKEGLETIMQIRACGATTPIIAMSGGGRVGNADFLKMAAELGANEVLPKPFERHDLTGAVRRLLPS
jgi:DNA-binding response OmpR family regulator